MQRLREIAIDVIRKNIEDIEALINQLNDAEGTMRLAVLVLSLKLQLEELEKQQ